MKKSEKIILILFLFISLTGHAQENNEITLPKIIPPSPEAVALGKYGDYPVSAATGVPEISIPIFTIQQGDITIPISISYHASGIKIADESGIIGLGWVLNYGGRISRYIAGTPDEYNSFPKPLKPSNTIDQLTWDGYHHLSNTESYNTEYDVFSYSIPGVSGKFILKETNNVLETVMLNHEPVKLSILNNRPLKFCITDVNSIQHVLKDIETTGADATSWLLTHIKSTAHPKDSVRFTYRRGTSYTKAWNRCCMIDDISQLSSIPADAYRIPTWINSDSDYTHNTLEVSEINFTNGQIRFSTNPSTGMVNNIEVFDAEGNLVKKVILKQTLFPKQTSRYKLDEVYFYDKNNILKSKYLFEYNLKNTMPGYNSFAIDYWGYYNGKNNTNLIPRQSFSINGIVVGGADRSVDPNYAQTYILKKITYPTGGYTTFEYESNNIHNTTIGGLRIRKTENYDHSGNNETKEYVYGRNGSGVGILYPYYLYDPKNYFHCQEKWYFYPGESVPKSLKRYTFTETPIGFMTGTNNDFYYDYVCEYLGTAASNIGKTEYFYASDHVQIQPISSTFNYTQKYIPVNKCWYPPLLTSKIVSAKTSDGYQTIYEQATTYLRKEINTATGFHVYRYALDLPEKHPVINPTTRPTFCFADYQLVSTAIKPDLNQEIHYVDGRATTFKATNYYYENEEHFLPTKQVIHDSNGDKLITYTKYPADYPLQEPYVTMVHDMFGRVIQEDQYLNDNHLFLKRFNYRKNWFSDEKLIALESITTQDRSQSSPESRIRYHSYDTCGNPTCVSYEDGPLIGYAWGYQGQYPIAKTENARSFQIIESFQQNPQSKELILEEPGDSQQILFYHSGGTISLAFHPRSGSEYAYYAFTGASVRRGYLCGGRDSSPCQGSGPDLRLTGMPAGDYNLVIYGTGLSNPAYVECTYIPKPTRTLTVEGESFYEGFEENEAAIAGQAAAGEKYHSSNYVVPFRALNRPYLIDYKYRENGVWKYKRTNYTNYMRLMDGDAIDEVRVYPADALMTTYTYKPLVGMTSETDPSGHTIFYEYDAFGRLKCIRDEEGNILKQHDYHYQQ